MLRRWMFFLLFTVSGWNWDASGCAALTPHAKHTHTHGKCEFINWMAVIRNDGAHNKSLRPYRFEYCAAVLYRHRQSPIRQTPHNSQYVSQNIIGVYFIRTMCAYKNPHCYQSSVLAVCQRSASHRHSNLYCFGSAHWIDSHAVQEYGHIVHPTSGCSTTNTYRHINIAHDDDVNLRH